MTPSTQASEDGWREACARIIDPLAFNDAAEFADQLANDEINAAFAKADEIAALPRPARTEAEGWRETWIAEEEDGPAVGLLLDGPDGSQIWTGDVAEATFAEIDTDEQEALGESAAHGPLVVVARKGEPLRIVARACGLDAANEIARAIAKTIPPSLAGGR